MRAISGAITSAYGGEAVKLTSKREFTSYLARIKGRAVLVTSTGIGGPSTSIAIDELASIGVKNFIRVGTSGAIRSDIATGDVVVTTASMGLRGGVVTGVINRSRSGEITKEDLLSGEENAIKTAVTALGNLPENIL